MKIGVALSGCDIGGISSYAVLKLLEDKGFDIEMVSSCSVASIGAMMYSCGFDTEKARKTAEKFVCETAESNLDAATFTAAESFSPLMLGRSKDLAVSAADTSDRRIVTFTNAFSLDTGKLRTYPLLDAYDALSASISLMDGLCGYKYKGSRLCDYGIWHGCPLYPLKIRGVSRIVSIAFLPLRPKTSYEALIKNMTESGSEGASVHIPIEFDGDTISPDEYDDCAVKEIKDSMNRIYWRALF